MIPFMSSVSCLFNSLDHVAESEIEQHKRQLLNIVNSWGFDLQEIPGDGNCCFAAIAFSLHQQRQSIELKQPQLLLDYGIDNSATLTDITSKLRNIAVEEWIKNCDEYKHFLDEGHDVVKEAKMFLQNGDFFGPLGNTMVLAISNALGIPIIVFSSAAHYPVINITPRVCHLSVPLYVAFNQAGAGHYDAVIENSNPSTSSRDALPKITYKHCCCGKGSKSHSLTQICVMLKFKYTTSIRCPCLSANKPCTPMCSCSNCGNPIGTKPSKKGRQRYKHAWTMQSKN